MAVTISRPEPAPLLDEETESDDEGQHDLEGDTRMGGGSTTVTRSRHAKAIVTPGEVITDDPQWMRCVSADILNMNRH